MDDLDLRRLVYRFFADHGRAPRLEQVAGWTGSEPDAHAAMQRLHDAQALVLDAAGGLIRMALPFSGIPTSHVVVGTSGQWWANCAWDALAIPIALGIDARIDARWIDDDSPVELEVTGAGLSRTDGLVHFAVPAGRWWDDIVET